MSTNFVLIAEDSSVRKRGERNSYHYESDRHSPETEIHTVSVTHRTHCGPHCSGEGHSPRDCTRGGFLVGGGVRPLCWGPGKSPEFRGEEGKKNVAGEGHAGRGGAHLSSCRKAVVAEGCRRRCGEGPGRSGKPGDIKGDDSGKCRPTQALRAIMQRNSMIRFTF